MCRYSTFTRRVGVGCVSALLAVAALGCASKEKVTGGGGDSAGTAGTSSGGSGGSTSTSGGGSIVFPQDCGNGIVDPKEQCDDKNAVDDDGCKSDCTFTCVATSDAGTDPVCDDGNPCNGAETCNDQHVCAPGTTAPNGTSCGAGNLCLNGECITPNLQCGDGTKSGTEECDDGNDVDGDGCDSDCKFSCSATRTCPTADACAGTVQCNMTTHRCVSSGGALTDGTPCPQDANRVCYQGACTACGNGTVSTGEECDDGNFDPSDGCEPTCLFSCDPSDSTRDCGQSNPCMNNGTCDTTSHTCSSITAVANGTACGSALICINGTCQPSTCHDTVWDPTSAEECDDTNNIANDGCDNDCTFSCESQQECDTKLGAAPACRAWSCTAEHVCDDVADATQDGVACDVGGGAATCKSGACTAGACGNGIRENGEVCDLGVLNDGGLGCDADCTLSCTSDADCNNGNPCDGVEICEDVSVSASGIFPAQSAAKCSPPIVQADTTSCGASGEECFEGVCRVGFCGDGFTDGSAGEECDPPTQGLCTADCQALTRCDYSGYWALKNTIPVSWEGGGVLIAGSGDIEQWVLLKIAQSGTDLDMEFKVCGLTAPDFTTTAALNNETYGTTFPNAIWDSGTVPTAQVKGIVGLTPGSILSTSSVAVVIGANMTDPFGLWPEDLATFMSSTSGITITNPDNDTDSIGPLMGVTTPTKSGGSYSDIIVNILENPFGRANQMQLVVRQISSQIGVIESCGEMTGDVAAVEEDIHVIGCIRSNGANTGARCTNAEYTLADRSRPHFALSPGTSHAIKLTSLTPSCSLVRSTVP